MAFTGSADDAFAIVEQFDRSDVTYLHLKTPEFEITLSRLAELPGDAGTTQPASTSVVGSAPAVAETPSPTQPSQAAPAVPAPVADPSLHTVQAPMVGVFYVAPKPGEPPFVEVGSAVEPDSTVGLLEAMKVFTAVRAETSGVVAEVLVKNGEFVEYGQPLLTVRTAG